ncbi:MAG: hypothetical protein HC942_30360, partial [Microcoleus sp. SU_5_6]|nr:hypothetical protein [Microcoleus sp. SU_5_6]
MGDEMIIQFCTIACSILPAGCDYLVAGSSLAATGRVDEDAALVLKK